LSGNHSFAILWLAAASACGGANLGGRPCSPEGTCLTGFRCRQGQCVAQSDEVCDGEDNNGNGFIDENLYQPLLPTLQLPSLGGHIGGPPAIAAGQDRALLAWPVSDDTEINWDLSVVLVDPAGRALGGTQALVPHSAMGGLSALSAAVIPTGFALVYEDGVALDNFAIRLIRFDAQGTPGVPELLSANTLFPRASAVGWAGDGLVVAIVHDPQGPPLATTESRGIFLLRSGQAPERVAGAALRDEHVELSTSGSRVAIGWIECALTATDGGPPPPPGTCFAGGSVGQIRILGSTPTSVALPNANALSLRWAGEELDVAWVDISNVSVPRVVVSRFDAAGSPLHADLKINDQSLIVNSVALVRQAGELGVLWTEGLQADQAFFARVDPQRGRIGDVLEVGSFLGPDIAGAFAGPGSFPGTNGYAFWMGSGEVMLAQIQCTNTPPARRDGGPPQPDGGPTPLPLDGGPPAPDGGGPALDGGLQGPLCDPNPADGGPSVSGQILYYSGGPIPGLDVIVGSCRTQTDTEGRFAAAGIDAPYDLTVLTRYDTTDYTVAQSFLGVPTVTPVVRVPMVPMAARSTWTGTYNPPSGREGELCIFSDIGQRAQVSSGAFRVSIPVAPASGDVQALFFETDSSGDFQRAQFFPGISVTPDGVNDLGTLAPIGIGSRLLPAEMPPSSHSDVGMLWQLGGVAAPIGTLSPTTTAFAMALPVPPPEIPGSAYLVATLKFADDSQAAATSPLIDSSVAEVRFSLPDAPMQIAPAYNAQGVGISPLLMESAVDGASYYGAEIVQQNPDGSALFLILYSATPSMHVPDLSVFGTLLRPGNGVGWVAGAFTGATFDDLFSGVLSISIASPELSPPGLAARFSAFSEFVP
jgi:hypothetical protein